MDQSGWKKFPDTSANESWVCPSASSGKWRQTIVKSCGQLLFMMRWILGKDDFVASGTPGIDKIQRSSTRRPQSVQRESLTCNKFQYVSTRHGNWFVTRRLAVLTGEFTARKSTRPKANFSGEFF
jgi:hypothetical protein